MTPRPPPDLPAPRRPPGLRLDADLHVVPAPGGLPAAMARAAARGLADLGITAHARAEPGWLDRYVETVRAAGALSRTRVHCGLELTLAADGSTDLPPEIHGRLALVDYVVLVVERPPAALPRLAVRVVLAGPAAAGCARPGFTVEVTERWRTPSVRAAEALAALGIPLTAGSAARAAAEVGRWDHVRAVAAALAPVPHPG